MDRTALIGALVGLGFAGTHLQAQSFDAASVKPSKPGTRVPYTMENGRYVANATLFGNIGSAWDLMLSREQSEAMLAQIPKWISTDYYEIRAVAPGNPTKDQLRLMVRSLLADRFRLQVHTVTVEADVLALVLAKPGVTGRTLRTHSEGQPCDVHLSSPTQAVGVFPPICGQYVATAAPHAGVLLAGRDMTMKQIATAFSSLGILTRQAVDQTGLSGQFDLKIEFNPERKGPAPDAQPDDFQPTTFRHARSTRGRVTCCHVAGFRVP
jgi:uncharacterized protein (TIGR03435 family)